MKIQPNQDPMSSHVELLVQYWAFLKPSASLVAPAAPTFGFLAQFAEFAMYLFCLSSKTRDPVAVQTYPSSRDGNRCLENPVLYQRQSSSLVR